MIPGGAGYVNLLFAGSVAGLGRKLGGVALRAVDKGIIAPCENKSSHFS